MHKQLYTVRKQLEQTGNTSTTYLPTSVKKREISPDHITLHHRLTEQIQSLKLKLKFTAHSSDCVTNHPTVFRAKKTSQWDRGQKSIKRKVSQRLHWNLGVHLSSSCGTRVISLQLQTEQSRRTCCASTGATDCGVVWSPLPLSSLARYHYTHIPTETEKLPFDLYHR